MRLEGLRVVEWLGPRGRRLRFGYPPGVTPTRFGPNALRLDLLVLLPRDLGYTHRTTSQILDQFVD
jgi:hypothetical protein